MIKNLERDTLELRRKKARLPLIYKLSQNLINIDSTKCLFPHSEGWMRKYHQFNHIIPYVCRDVFKFSYFPIIIYGWNSLPKEIVKSISLDYFKFNLSTFFSDSPECCW